MNHQFSVLGLLFSVLILAENTITVLNNVLQSKPMNMENSHSTIKMNTTFLNKKFINFDRKRNLNVLYSSRLNNIVPVTSFVSSSQINRYPRQVSNKNNNEDTEYKRYIKVILDLRPDNYEDMYDYYNNRKYNDNREKKINGQIDKLNLHREILQNSKPITRHLNESQVRKRCTMKMTQNLGSINHQQFQKQLSTNIEDGVKTSLKCKDCEILKSNTNQEEPKKNLNSNLQLEQKDDDYYIKILNQLNEKKNKPKNVKSALLKDQPIQKSIEPTILENRLVENPNINSSFSEEIVVKFEKIKGNRTINKLESSPKNTFVNGNWVRNKNIENKVNDFKPIENYRSSDSNNKNESISKYDVKQLNLEDSKNKVIETNDNISKKSKDLSEVTVQENKYISPSPLPEENELLLFSKEGIKPVIVSSTSKHNSDSSMIEDSSKLKFTTKEYSDQINKEDNVLSYNENNTNQDKQIESTINNFPTMATIFKSNEELTSDLNEASNLQEPDRIVESNSDNPKTNYSDDDTFVEDSILDEKQNNSSDDNVNCKCNCNCNKKINKNILNSAIMRNITEIKTDMYTSPNSSKTNSHKRSNQLLKKNGVINKSKNTTNEENLIKNKKDLNSDLLGEKQSSYENTSKNNLKESNVNLLQGSMLNIDDNQAQGMKDNRANENKEINSNNFSFSSMIPELKLNKGQRKINKIENINKVKEINNEKMSLIHKNLPQINTNQYVAKLKRFPQNDETSIDNNNMENNNMDRTTENNNIFTKNSAQMPNKIISRTPLKTIPEKLSKQIENITKKSPRELIGKIKYNIPINSRIKSNFGDYNNTNYMVSTKKSPRILSEVPIKNIYKHSPQTISRDLEKLMDDYDINATKNSSKKLITESDKYNKFTSFNTNTRIVEKLKENNINKKIISRKDNINTNNLEHLQLQNPSGLVKTIESTKIKITPTNIYSTKVPTVYGKNRNTNTINKKVLKSKISKPALLVQNPNTSGSSDTTKQIKNNENMSILKLKKAKTPNSEPLFSNKIAKTKNNLFDKPLTLTLKNKQHVLHDQFPTEQVFTKNTDTKQNLKFKYDADSNVLLKSYPPEQSQVEGVYDHEHAPYTNEYLEPIVFGESMTKDNKSNNNTQFVIHSPISRQSSSNRNRKHNKSDVRLSQPVPINSPEQDENFIVTLQRNNKVEVNVKKQEYQPDLNISNDVPFNTEMTDNDKYDVRDPNDGSPNPNRFGLLSQVKITDGVFKIPLISQTSVDNNGSEYVSEIFVPIEKPDGRHAAISLTKLLTGEFKLLNEPGEENLSVIEPTPEMDSTLCSTRTSTDCESSVITDYPVNPNPSKILQAIKDEKKLSSPIHIIQIINNGQCSNKHNITDTIKNSVLDNDDHKFHKSRNECRRLSSIRSQNTPNNNGKINRKIGNAYKHFDSAILDRFLQVYSPHLV